LGDLLDGANPFVTDSTCTDAFAIGGSCTITATRTVGADDPDPLPNTVTVTCNAPGSTADIKASSSHEVNLFQPSYTIAKSCAGPDGTSKTITLGDTLTYTFTITNTSSADSPDLVLASINDPLLGGDLSAAATAQGCDVLTDSEACTFTVQHTPTATGTVPNTVTAVYNPDGFPNVLEETASDTCTVEEGGEGCTPGFWQGGLGKTLWDQVNDPDWTSHGGEGTNPYTTTTVFSTFFQPTGVSTVDNATMLQLVGTGGGNNPARKAARDLVAAYLNASFGINFPFDTTTILADWAAAVAGGNPGFNAFHAKYSAANQLGCTID
jgi:hypothetical protein